LCQSHFLTATDTAGNYEEFGLVCVDDIQRSAPCSQPQRPLSLTNLFTEELADASLGKLDTLVEKIAMLPVIGRSCRAPRSRPVAHK
jgi:hypothetical protein